MKITVEVEGYLFGTARLEYNEDRRLFAMKTIWTAFMHMWHLVEEKTDLSPQDRKELIHALYDAGASVEWNVEDLEENSDALGVEAITRHFPHLRGSITDKKKRIYALLVEALEQLDEIYKCLIYKKSRWIELQASMGDYENEGIPAHEDQLAKIDEFCDVAMAAMYLGPYEAAPDSENEAGDDEEDGDNEDGNN